VDDGVSLGGHARVLKGWGRTTIGMMAITPRYAVRSR
jgi:hypothetical protein